MGHKVFICHSSRDKAIADAACMALESNKVECWIAPRNILAGDEYGDSIIQAISSSEIVLLIFSKPANDSPQVRREIERAVHYERVIVPFRIDETMPSRAMEYALGNTHWLDAIKPPMEARLLELCNSIFQILGRRTVATVQLREEAPSVRSPSAANGSGEYSDMLIMPNGNVLPRSCLYEIFCDGTTYGPYTVADIRRYVASGNIDPSDLAKSLIAADRFPVSRLLD